jgi:hypothetical protein
MYKRTVPPTLSWFSVNFGYKLFNSLSTLSNRSSNNSFLLYLILTNSSPNSVSLFYNSFIYFASSSILVSIWMNFSSVFVLTNPTCKFSDRYFVISYSFNSSCVLIVSKTLFYYLSLSSFSIGA